MKANLRKKLTAAASMLTAGMMIFSAGVLTGCGKNDGQSGDPSASLTEEQRKSMSYKVTDVELPLVAPTNAGDNGGYGSIVFKNGRLYGVRTTNHVDMETFDASFEIEIIIVDMDGNVVSTIPVYSSASFKENYASAKGGLIVTDEGNISYILRERTTDPGTSEFIEKYTIKTVSSDGAEISSIPMDNIITEEERRNSDMYVADIYKGNDGNIYCNLGSCIRAFDSAGKFLFTTRPFDTTGNAWVNSFFITNEGVPAIAYNSYDEMADVSSYKVCEIDIAARDFGREYTLPGYISSGSLYNGGGDFYAICQSDSGLRGIVYDKASDSFSTQDVIDLLAIGIDTSQMTSCTFSEDGTVLIAANVNDEKCRVSLAEPSEEADPTKKTPITVGCYYLDWGIRSAIADFNKTSDKYVVSVQSYSDSNDIQDHEAASTKFNNELLAGNIPDVLLINEQMPVASYEAKGLFADLYDFIDKDASISRDDLAPNVLTALDNNGRLYTIGKGFDLNTFAAKKDIVGDRNKITFDEAREYLSQMPEGSRLFDESQTAGDLLNWGIITGGYVDFANGTCSFDSDSFKELLEFTKDYPTELDYDKLTADNPNFWEDREMAVYNGKTLFGNVWISDYINARGYLAFFGGDAAFTGFPTSNPAGGSAISIKQELAISSQSECREGAWEFVKSTLTSGTVTDDGHVNGFPTYLPKLDDVKSATMEAAAKIDPIIDVQIVGSMEVKLPPVDRDYLDFVTNEVYSVTNVTHYDTAILNIINEEVAAYYAGTKSADETASVIQSRVNLFLCEQN